jgi:hypothetical protein
MCRNTHVLVSFLAAVVIHADIEEDTCGHTSLLQTSLKLASAPERLPRSKARSKSFQIKFPNGDDACPDRSSDNVAMRGITNPTYVRLPNTNQVLVAFRAVCRSSWYGYDPFQFNVDNPLNFEMPWVSSAVMMGIGSFDVIHGNASWTHHGRIRDPRFMQEGTNDVRECESMISNKTKKVFTHVEGIEDPRLFVSNGRTYLLFVASPVRRYSAAFLAGLKGDLNPKCGPIAATMWVTEVLSTSPSFVFGPAHPLIKHHMGWREKNWSPFNWRSSDNQPDQVMLVYSIFPHAILKANFSTGEVRQLYSSPWHQPLIHQWTSQKDVHPQELHGGATPVPYRCGAHVGKDASTFLGVFHRNVATGGANAGYAHWAYKFSSQPPFEISAIAKRSLPLRRKATRMLSKFPVAFVTGVSIESGNVVITYGVGDVQAEVLHMSCDDFEASFFGDVDVDRAN